MLHWERAGRIRQGAALIVLAACLCAVGCGSKKPKAPERAAAKAAGTEKKKEAPPLAGEVRDLDLTLTDKNGVTVARVRARSGLIGQTGAGSAAGAVTRTEATLYEKGKPTAVVTANRIAADRATRTVRGEGDVVARSLVQPGSPTVRADRMTWQPGENQIRGRGNVLLTRAGFRMPGDSFVADTRLRRVTVQASDAPTTGRLETSER